MAWKLRPSTIHAYLASLIEASLYLKALKGVKMMSQIAWNWQKGSHISIGNTTKMLTVINFKTEWPGELHFCKLTLILTSFSFFNSLLWGPHFEFHPWNKFNSVSMFSLFTKFSLKGTKPAAVSFSCGNSYFFNSISSLQLIHKYLLRSYWFHKSFVKARNK